MINLLAEISKLPLGLDQNYHADISTTAFFKKVSVKYLFAFAQNTAKK